MNPDLVKELEQFPTQNSFVPLYRAIHDKFTRLKSELLVNPLITWVTNEHYTIEYFGVKQPVTEVKSTFDNIMNLHK